MASILGDLPSFDPHNFSQYRPSDPSNPSMKLSAGTAPVYVHLPSILEDGLERRPK